VRTRRVLAGWVLVAWCAGSGAAAAAPTTSLCDVAVRAWLAQPRNPVRRPRPSEAAALQQVQADAAGTTDAAAVREFWQRVDRVQTELSARQLTVPIVNVEGGRVAAVIDKAHVGPLVTEDGPTWFLAFHLQLGNDSAQPLTVPRDRIQAVIGGKELPTQEIRGRLIHQGFSHGSDYYPLEACQPAKELSIPPRGVSGTWLVYGGLPVTPTLPSCQIAIQLTDRKLDIDVPGVQRALLDLSVEPMGPHRGLALLTLGGTLNAFNMYALVEEFELLATQKIHRVVLQWRPSTPLPDSQLLSWLQNSALSVGTGRTVSEQLPALPSSLRELHLVEAVKGSFLAPEFTSHPQAPPKVHNTDAEAVSAALRTTYHTLPREELLAEIRTGHRLSQAAALVHGAPRLDVADLPLILERSQSDDVAVRRAALLALGDFEQPAALDRLEQTLRSGNDVDLSAATVALSESRFQAARDRFTAVLHSGDKTLERKLVTVLAQRPRPEWADEIAQHAVDEQGRLQVDFVRALVQLNDPRLVDLLAPALQGNDSSLQDLAFQILSDRHEERAEQLASEFVRKRLREAPPDALMMTFLNRTKDPRAIPLLLKYLDAPGGKATDDKAPLINLLGQIGDVPVGDALIRLHARWQPHEQVAALLAIRQLRHPQFVQVAAAALDGKVDMVSTHAIQGLAQVGGPEAERLLCEALLKSDRAPLMVQLGMAVASFGSDAARHALQQARISTLPQRRLAGVEGLRLLRQNSPGYAYWEQGLLHARDEKYDEALEAFKLASQLDPQLPEAYAGQGDIHLKQQRYPDAEKTFGKSYELDPTNGLACSGLAIAQVMQGRLEEGLQTVEKVREQFTQDVNYAYNVACVYGRAAETLAKQPASAERDARLAKFQQQALDDLKQAIKLKFDDYEWMRKDPDLKSLHDLPAFQTLTRDPDDDK
jgi:Flp pilus assembly protein TadD